MDTIEFTIAPVAPRPRNDFALSDHGSIVLFHPLTIEAQLWWEEHAGPGPSLGSARAVEPRYVLNLVEGIEADGLTIA